MKKTQLNEFQAKSKEEMLKTLSELKSDVSKISVQLKGDRMKDVALNGKKRKEIAQILTILKEKEKKNL